MLTCRGRLGNLCSFIKEKHGTVLVCMNRERHLIRTAREWSTTATLAKCPRKQNTSVNRWLNFTNKKNRARCTIVWRFHFILLSLIYHCVAFFFLGQLLVRLAMICIILTTIWWSWSGSGRRSRTWTYICEHYLWFLIQLLQCYCCFKLWAEHFQIVFFI